MTKTLLLFFREILLATAEGGWKEKDGKLLPNLSCPQGIHHQGLHEGFHLLHFTSKMEYKVSNGGFSRITPAI